MERPAKPLPVPDLDTLPFWEACTRHEIRAQQCTQCQQFRWPPQAICPDCHSFEAKWQQIQPTASLYSYTIVHHVAVPAFEADVPFVSARAMMEDTGGRVIIPGRLRGVPFEKIYIGMPLDVVFEEISGGKVILPSFRPRTGSLP